MEEWKEYKLGDVCNISSSKRIFAKEYCDDDAFKYINGVLDQL